MLFDLLQWLPPLLFYQCTFSAQEQDQQQVEKHFEMEPAVHDDDHQGDSRKKSKFDAKRTGPQTTYDADGNWTVFQHQDKLRQMKNDMFETYYGETQAIVPSDEWPSLMEALRTPLPTTIWINDTDPLAREVSAYFKSLDASIVEPIPWYPIEGMAWRIKADKATFRKRPDMQPLRQYLIQQTALGTISRQEEVSMIPPLLLDIQSTDLCLDVCASPGSKTAQMLVALGRQKKVPFDSDASPFPFDYLSAGLVMANELDTKRANMLVHQCKRMRLLFPFALFSNHDARYLPDVLLTDDTTAVAYPLRFDKILCDVVCSGDGTIRKAPFIFKIWSPKEALQLQRTQIQIALRGAHLLKVGGRLVYSTCSLNPIENEAVVYQIALRTRGALKLIDARHLLPGLDCAAGMTTWAVTNSKGKIVGEPNESCHAALFPPPNRDAVDAIPNGGLDLTKCMRLFPRHCNGGGFFIAVFEKVEEWQLPPRSTEDESNGGSPTGENHEQCPTKRPRPHDTKPKDHKKKEARKEETTTREDAQDESSLGPRKMLAPQFLPAAEAVVRSLTDFYQVHGFPTQNLVTRAAPNERTLKIGVNTTATLVSNTALKILQQKQDNLVIVSAGLRVLAHEMLDKGWRIASESAILFAKFMTKSNRLLDIDLATAEVMMSNGKLKEVLFTDIADCKFRETVESLSVGTVLLRIQCPTAPDGGCVYTVALRARSRLQLLVDHEDLPGLKLRLGLAAECNDEAE